MAAQLDRQTLESMKRADLQRLCKDHGIKANLKSEALIDLLLDTPQPLVRTAPVPGPSSRRASSMRVVSRSSAGARPRGHSGSSMIIHDTDDEEEMERDMIQSEPEPSRGADLGPRRRKAKETQFRLGVGRPAVAGGSGAREITRSMSVPKSTRSRGSRSRKPTEAAIQEEDEGEGMEAEPLNALEGPSQPPVSQRGAQPAPSLSIPSDLSPQLDGYLTAAMTPFQEQMQAMQSELRRLADELVGLTALKSKLVELTAEVEVLREKASHTAGLEAEVQALKNAMSNLNLAGRVDVPSPVKLVDASDYLMSDPDVIPGNIADITANTAEAFASGLGASSTPAVRRFSPTTQAPPPSLLGKRHRPADEANDSGVFDAGEAADLSERDLAQRVVRPSKKRAKMSELGLGAGPSTRSMSPAMREDPQPGPSASESVAKGPGFTIFNGPEEPLDDYVDPPPPTTHLSDLFTFPPGHTPPPIGANGPITETANANENRAQQNAPFAFNFTNAVFQPVTSTPAPGYGITLPSFSYPEPPTSPTPTGPSGGYIERAGGRRERNDLFNPHVGPRRPKSAASRKGTPTRESQPQAGPSTSNTGASQQTCIDPNALMRTPPLSSIPEDMPPSETAPRAAPAASSVAIGAGLGMGVLPLPPETPAPPMKRTMYGTELDGDTRFGDFGVEGVATGFWAGPARRF
ncbi:hypothetical protein CERSUDRAFT_120716 [Gelatoporia subvermispora B]|uniref:Uncharacterized protein n=1 Tax=Ceriporiopsis subvermispora (strain B) TaxID=914234 RepID=M2RBC6_CERS8|nr:hypothetical protein CERSUDRAFT_120716 [Gelatoporia subvermispora B]